MERPMRLRLDLTEVNSLPFKYVWVPLSPRELRTIGDFKSTLYKKFDFDKTKNIKLFVQDSLLLDHETVLLLREDDIVKVVYDKETVLSVNPEDISSSSLNSKKKKNRKLSEIDKEKDLNTISILSQSYSKYLDLSKSEEISELNTTTVNKFKIITSNSDESESTYLAPEFTDDTISKKKNKHKKKEKYFEKCYSDENLIRQEGKDSDTIAHENGIHKKKKRKTNNNDLSLLSEGSVQSSSHISNDPKLPNVENQSTGAPTIPKSLITEAIHISSNNVGSSSLSHMKQSDLQKEPEQKNEVLQGNNCRKRKRRRPRKRDRVCPIEKQPNVDQLTKLNAFQTESISNYDRGVRKHIIFAENSYDLSAKVPRGDQTKVVDLSSYLQTFKSSNKETNEQNLSDGNMSNNITFTTPMMSTPRTSADDHISQWGVTPVMDTEDQTVLNNSKSYSFNSSTYEDKDAVGINYTALPPLNTIPEIGTRIAFKLLELSDLYCPEVSDFKEGIVKNINSQTDEMEVELAKVEVKPGRTGKFENLHPDIEPDAIVIKNVKLNWSSLIEPKLVRKT